MEIKIITSYDDLIKDLIHEKITMVRPTESNIPELYKDLKYIDEQKRVWYPNVINTPEKGVVFVNGKSKDNWQWASIKSVPLTKKEMKNPRFKGQTHKSDPKSLQNHGQDGFYDACDSLGFFELENVQE